VTPVLIPTLKKDGKFRNIASLLYNSDKDGIVIKPGKVPESSRLYDKG
jgi:hypothetical protein